MENLARPLDAVSSDAGIGGYRKGAKVYKEVFGQNEKGMQSIVARRFTLHQQCRPVVGQALEKRLCLCRISRGAAEPPKERRQRP